MFGRIALVCFVGAVIMALWPMLRDMGERMATKRQRLEEELEAARRHPEQPSKDAARIRELEEQLAKQSRPKEPPNDSGA